MVSSKSKKLTNISVMKLIEARTGYAFETSNSFKEYANKITLKA